MQASNSCAVRGSPLACRAPQPVRAGRRSVQVRWQAGNIVGVSLMCQAPPLRLPASGGVAVMAARCSSRPAAAPACMGEVQQCIGACMVGRQPGALPPPRPPPPVLGKRCAASSLAQSVPHFADDRPAACTEAASRWNRARPTGGTSCCLYHAAPSSHWPATAALLACLPACLPAGHSQEGCRRSQSGHRGRDRR